METWSNDCLDRGCSSAYGGNDEAPESQADPSVAPHTPTWSSVDYNGQDEISFTDDNYKMCVMLSHAW